MVLEQILLKLLHPTAQHNRHLTRYHLQEKIIVLFATKGFPHYDSVKYLNNMH